MRFLKLLFLVALPLLAPLAFAASFQNLYEVLGVRRKANSKEIKKAYRRLALEKHPDKQAPFASAQEEEKATSAFQEVAVAYETLSDPQRRREYDAELKYGAQQPMGGHGRRHRHDPFAGAGGGPFGDPFDGPFGGPFGGQSPGGGRKFMFTRNGRTYVFEDPGEQFGFRAGRQGRRRNSLLFDVLWPVLKQIALFAAIWWFVRTAMLTAEDQEQEGGGGGGARGRQGSGRNPAAPSPSSTTSGPERVKAHDVAKTHAPHVQRFEARFLRQRARRTVVFPLARSSLKDPLVWQALEQIALEFRTDPLSFTWVDLEAEPRWGAFLADEFGGSTLPLLVVVGSSGSKGAAFQSEEQGVGRITPLSPDRERASRWLLRVVEGTESLSPLNGEVPSSGLIGEVRYM